MGVSRTKIIKRWMQKIANGLEIALSIFVAVVLLLLIIRMVITLTPEAWAGEVGVSTVLVEALEIAIGVEFIKMLCLHTPGTVLEVLLFAIARHMIVKETTALETLLGIVSIAGLFAIHKFLLVSHREIEHISFKAATTVGFVNLSSGVNLQENNSASIGAYVARKLKEKGEKLEVGATVYLKNCLLRIEKMDGDRIARVELVHKE